MSQPPELHQLASVLGQSLSLVPLGVTKRGLQGGLPGDNARLPQLTHKCLCGCHELASSTLWWIRWPRLTGSCASALASFCLSRCGGCYLLCAPHSEARAWDPGECFIHLLPSVVQAFGDVGLLASPFPLCQPLHIHGGSKALWLDLVALETQAQRKRPLALLVSSSLWRGKFENPHWKARSKH